MSGSVGNVCLQGFFAVPSSPLGGADVTLYNIVEKPLLSVEL